MESSTKSKNQLWKESNTSLSFKEWMDREIKKGNFAPKEQLSADGVPSLGENLTDMTKFENILGMNKPDQNNNTTVFGLSKPILIGSVVLIVGAIVYKIYQNRK